MRQSLLFAIAGTALALFSAPQAASACGEVEIASMNWESAAIAAEVDKFILEKGFGCQIRLVKGDTIPTFETMLANGKPDIAPELWVNSINERLSEAVRSGKLAQGAEILADGAVEGWWIPKFIADAHPSIRTVQDALANPQLFSKENGEGRGVVHSCPPDWACRVTTANLFRAVGAQDKGFDLLNTSSGEELEASIAKAIAAKTGWLGYYWAPTGILARHEMVKLSFDVPFDQLEWDSCTSVAGCLNPKVNSYPTSQAFTLMTAAFAQREPEISSYLQQRKWGNATVSALIAWKDDNKVSQTEAARHFLKENLGIWTRWLSPDVAEKVKSAL
ncbi:glycine betaine ABC transporter substrate-binding protein [Rhizobium helianthi]|uniref:Glycine betaine ABC transporter substrate-binding protein n=1 Tax=Rhizobium helianthi TaxID=1132695 RepID=A0ABW4M0S8_9HYPH